MQNNATLRGGEGKRRDNLLDWETLWDYSLVVGVCGTGTQMGGRRERQTQDKQHREGDRLTV